MQITMVSYNRVVNQNYTNEYLSLSNDFWKLSNWTFEKWHTDTTTHKKKKKYMTMWKKKSNGKEMALIVYPEENKYIYNWVNPDF